MCLGLPAQVVSADTGHADLVRVDLAGVPRLVNIGLLDAAAAPVPGDWVLVHMGFVLSVISEQEARDALSALAYEQEAVAELVRRPGP